MMSGLSADLHGGIAVMQDSKSKHTRHLHQTYRTEWEKDPGFTGRGTVLYTGGFNHRSVGKNRIKDFTMHMYDNV